MSKIIETNNTAKIIHKFIEDGHVPRHGISYFEALEKCAKAIEAEILAAQWIDGPPKDTGEGRFVLVQSRGYKVTTTERIWDATQDRLDFIIDFNGPVVKHMRLPEYE